MTRAAFLKFHANRCAQLRELCDRKGHDYADEDDQFANFTLVETLSMGRISALDGILTRLTDKLARIAKHIDPHADMLVDESLSNDCGDAINYLLLLEACARFGAVEGDGADLLCESGERAERFLSGAAEGNGSDR